MSEIEDVLLDTEFAAYRERLVAAVQPAGPAVVRATVRRRRRRAVIATAVAVVLAAAIPVAANAALGLRTGPPSVPAETVDPSGPPTASPTPSASPPPSGSNPAAADGLISRDELLAARLDLPVWRTSLDSTCTTRSVLLRTPDTTEYVPVLLAGPEHGDVDGDGVAETVVVVGCRYGEALAKQVVAFDRDTTGRITTTGRVVDTGARIGDITDVAVDADGSVRVRVANLQPCCGTSPDAVVRQWRTYAWSGGRFVQTAGPTTFPSRTPDAPAPGTSAPVRVSLTVSAAPLVYGPPNGDGVRRGTSTVTITNTGTGTVEFPLITFLNNGRDDAVHAEWGSECPRGEGRPDGVTCIATPLRPGERRSIEFPFLTTSSGPGGEATVRVAAGTGEGVALLPGTSAVSATFPVSFG